MIVLGQGLLEKKVPRDYVRAGYGAIQIPDLSRVSASTAHRFLEVTADEIQEFLEDNQEVIILKRRADRWASSLNEKLAERNLVVKTKGLD